MIKTLDKYNKFQAGAIFLPLQGSMNRKLRFTRFEKDQWPVERTASLS